MKLALVFLFASLAFAGDRVKVRSIQFSDFPQVSQAEILERLNEREVRLVVEKPYRPEYAEEARFYLAQLLSEKGCPDARIEVETKVVGRRAVEVRFRLLK